MIILLFLISTAIVAIVAKATYNSGFFQKHTFVLLMYPAGLVNNKILDLISK